MDEDYTDEQIRDWYAGQALVGLCSPQSPPTPPLASVAVSAFNIADAMMAEREKRKEWQPVRVRPESQQTPINPS